MADHIYKPHEVPKGERWQYFKDYYLKTTIVIVLILFALISIIKTTMFSPKPDVSLLVAYATPVNTEVWEEASAGLQAMPLDLNGDGSVLLDINPLHLDPNMEKTNVEMYIAAQNKFMVSLSAAEYALQIVDDNLFETLSHEELIGTYAELPDAMGHKPEDIIKIPLKELSPFNAIEDFPEGLYMTLRPKNAMQIGNSKKKLANYERQVQALMIMMQQ
ncbi:MAG: hypothetical protein E7403_04980 [Ruminococcaceae bacterium]|nr:hypothetical protein [Oscillospiraceae bacterium]